LQFLLENGKKRTFSYKVALKNFHGRAKGGHRTVVLPLNTPLVEPQLAEIKLSVF